MNRRHWPAIFGVVGTIFLFGLQYSHAQSVATIEHNQCSPIFTKLKDTKVVIKSICCGMCAEAEYLKN